MTWRNDRTGINEIKLTLNAPTELDVLVEFNDVSKVRRATVIGSVYGHGSTSDEAKFDLADKLERLAGIIRNEVVSRRSEQ